MLSAGYEWKQQSGDDFWRIELQPFFKPAFYFQSNLDIQRLYTNQVIVSMPSFQVDTYYSFLFSKTGQVCLGAGWDLGEILL